MLTDLKMYFMINTSKKEFKTLKFPKKSENLRTRRRLTDYYSLGIEKAEGIVTGRSTLDVDLKMFFMTNTS